MPVPRCRSREAHDIEGTLNSLSPFQGGRKALRTALLQDDATARQNGAAILGTLVGPVPDDGELGGQEARPVTERRYPVWAS